MRQRYIDLGENLRMLRKEKNLTQEQLADKAGVSRVAVMNIETGKSSPHFSTIELIAAALDVPIDDLSTVIRQNKKS